jgi:hypothetical protein
MPSASFLESRTSAMPCEKASTLTMHWWIGARSRPAWRPAGLDALLSLR